MQCPVTDAIAATVSFSSSSSFAIAPTAAVSFAVKTELRRTTARRQLRRQMAPRTGTMDLNPADASPLYDQHHYIRQINDSCNCKSFVLDLLKKKGNVYTESRLQS